MQPKLMSVFAAALATLAPGCVSAQQGFCVEAARFGTPIVTPTTLAPGDCFSIVTNLSCPIMRGTIPFFVDYWLVVPQYENNGYEPDILLARKNFEGNASYPIDIVNTTLPHAYYWPNTTYNVFMKIIYPTPGMTNGSQVNTTGGVYTPIDIQLPASS